MSKRRSLILFSVMALTALFSVVYLDLPHKFWFEDDPAQYAYVRSIGNPFEIFYNPAIMRGFGTGASLVPLQLLSYWLDVKLFGVSTVAAYLHSVLSLAVTAGLLYLVQARLTRNDLGAACISLLWVLLPSTVAVHTFISARHYVEGLAWCLVSALLLLDICAEPGDRVDYPKAACLALCTAAAMLSKEICITTLPSFLFLYSLYKRKYHLAAMQVVLVLAYSGYRLWLIGGVGHYPVSQLGAGDYLRYLAVLPYTLSANPGGYAILLAALLGGGWLLFFRFRETWKPFVLIGVLIVTALLASYPTASPLLGSFRIPGTWYRAAFIIDSVVLLSAGYLLARYAPRWAQVVCFLAMLVILVPGTEKTHGYWDFRLQSAEDEGRFYLNNPDKLLLSQERADWYMSGIDMLYEVRRPHYLNAKALRGQHARNMVAQFPSIWLIDQGAAVQDQQLYWQVKAQNY